MKQLFLALSMLGASAMPAFSQKSPTLLTLPQPTFVNSENPEFGSALSPDGSRFLFNRTSPDRQKMTLLETRFENGSWSKPEIPAFADTLFRDIDPIFSPDGWQILFSSNRPLPGRNTRDFNLWRLMSDAKIAVPLPETINSPDDEIFCGTDSAGNLYFARSQGNTFKIYCSKIFQNAYLPAEKLALPGTDSASISNPGISPDGKNLVFASAQLGGFGAADLFISKKKNDGSWTAPRNLGATVNSTYADFAPTFSADGKTLFFTSERRGIVGDFPAGKRRPGDLYSVDFEENTFERLAVLDVLKRYKTGWLEGDAEAVMSLFEPAARITPNGARGIDSLRNIRAFWFPADGSTTTIHRFGQEVLAVDFQGDIAFAAQKTMLDWSYQKDETRMGRIQNGYAHTVLRRQTDGSWRIWRQSWTDVGSRAKTLALPSGEPLRFRAKDGAEVFATAFFADEVPDKTRPLLLLFHMVRSNGLAEYQNVAPQLLDMGYNLLVVDHREGSGEEYGGENRTATTLGRPPGSDYCSARLDVEAALDYALASGFSGKKILWGSGLSAALVLQVAENQQDKLAGVLTFAPAQGELVAACEPSDALLARLKLPVVAFRAEAEMSQPGRKQQQEMFARNGIPYHVVRGGRHGSSVLDAARTGAPVFEAWELVEGFLKSHASTTPSMP